MYNYEELLNTFNNNPIVPVVAIENYKDAIPLAEKLLENGIGIIEITLRTAAAAKSMKELIDADMGIIVGAGAVYNIGQFQLIEDLNLDFAASPGHTDELLNYASKSSMPYLPGVMTSSEILKVMNAGFKIQKLFPVSMAGGIEAVQTYGDIYSGVKFCPTGGINFKNFLNFLNQPNVCAVSETCTANPKKATNSWWGEINNK